jgi:hypothetical protein
MRSSKLNLSARKDWHKPRERSAVNSAVRAAR